MVTDIHGCMDKAVAMLEVSMAAEPSKRDRHVFELHGYLTGLRDAYSVFGESMKMVEEEVASGTDDDE